MRAGKRAPPETAATIQEEPLLVWRPRPRIARVKIVGKMQDSKKLFKLVAGFIIGENEETYRTIDNIATPASPLTPIEIEMKIIMAVMNIKST